MTPFIQVAGIKVLRGARTILDIDNLAVAGGELLAVVGPNGSGKSTLLKVLALVLRPESGTVHVSGSANGAWEGDREALLAARRRVTMVFQSPVMLMRSVFDNVAAGLRFRGVPEAEVRSRTELWLKKLGVMSLASRRPAGLSGGEAQRVALARALVLQPDLLLLDEPTANLDWPTRTRLMGDLRAILSEIRAAAVLVTHDIHEAPHFADRLVVMRDGRIAQAGAPAEVVRRPVDVDTAVFLGHENVLPASMLGLPAGVPADAGNDRLVFCIGAERVRAGSPSEAPVDGQLVLKGQVLRIIPWGPLYRVSVECPPARDGLLAGTCDAADLREGLLAEGKTAQLVFAHSDGVFVPIAADGPTQA